MPAAYEELLEATIQHLEGLKSRGVRHVAVAPETLQALAKPPVKSPVSSPRPPITPPAAVPVAPATVSRPEPRIDPPVPKSEPAHPAPTVAPPSVKVPVSAPSMGSQPQSTSQLAPALEPAAKAAAFAALRPRVLACKKCENLASSRQNVVFGVGNIDAQLMFVGEAPGADEDAQGEPFVGRAGELLTKIIQATGLRRSDVYIANILKCRPDTPGQTIGNRKPTPAEMATCIPFLHEQIGLVRPKVLVALGVTAVEGLLGQTIGITKLRGHWQTYRGIPLMPTYHPSYLLHNQAITEKRKVWEDMLLVMEKLALPISEKQRNYFLRA